MIQAKIFRFVTPLGEQKEVHRIPAFATMIDEYNYYRIYWADPINIALLNCNYEKQEYMQSNPSFVLMESL